MSISTREQTNLDHMNWQVLCQKMTCSTEIEQAAILQPDGQILGRSPGFNIDLDNMEVKDLFVPARNTGKTFTVGGGHYLLLYASARTVHGKQIGTGGRCILVKNAYVILIGIYEKPPTTRNAAHTFVHRFAKCLTKDIERTEGESPGVPKSEEKIEEVNSWAYCSVM